MDDGPAGHAMTEIALALAMSFFCLLVLALVTMGASAPGAEADARIEALAAAPADGASEPLATSDRLVVFHGGRFFDADRRPLDPASLGPVSLGPMAPGPMAPGPMAPLQGGRLVLAVDPGLPLTEVLAARRRLAGRDLVVTPLDRAWLAALGPGAGR
jgi:hypothetical protein